MEKITTKTRILLWGVVGDKEKIDFELCDFSSDQVGDLDRLVRADGENKVRMTIEPEQKALQIGDITCDVGLVSLSCRGKGQKLKVRGFKSPDERAAALKRMAGADTPILLTIGEIQGSLFEKQETTNQTTAVGDQNQEIELKIKGIKGAKGLVSLRCYGGQWQGGYALQLGNQSVEVTPEDTPTLSSRAKTLLWIDRQIRGWLDSIIITGKVDQRRAMEARRDSMREQIGNQLAAAIRESMTAAPGSGEAMGDEEADEDKSND